MRIWTIKRISETPEQTCGVLIDDRFKPLCLTLEDPWRLNEKGKSCIPPGVWKAVPYDAPTYGETWEVQVPGRSAILFHPGNSEADTQGCILLGSEWGDGKPLDILESKKAFAAFKKMQPREFFWLNVFGVR